MTFVPVTPGNISRSWRMVLPSPVLLFATSSSSPDPWREHLLYCFRAALVGSRVGEELTSFPDFPFRTFPLLHTFARVLHTLPFPLLLHIWQPSPKFWGLSWNKVFSEKKDLLSFAEFWKWDETNLNLQPRVGSFVKIKEELLHKIVVQRFWMGIGNWKDFKCEVRSMIEQYSLPSPSVCDKGGGVVRWS